MQRSKNENCITVTSTRYRSRSNSIPEFVQSLAAQHGGEKHPLGLEAALYLHGRGVTVDKLVRERAVCMLRVAVHGKDLSEETRKVVEPVHRQRAVFAI